MPCRDRLSTILLLVMALAACGEMDPDEPLLTFEEARGLYDGSHHEFLLADSTAIIELTVTDSTLSARVNCPLGGQARVEVDFAFWNRADTSYARASRHTTYTDCKVNGAGHAEDVEFIVTGPGVEDEITLGMYPDSLLATGWVRGPLEWAIEAEARSGRCDVDLQGEGRWEIVDLMNITGEGVFGGLLCDHSFEIEWVPIVVVIQGRFVSSITGRGFPLRESSTGALTWPSPAENGDVP